MFGLGFVLSFGYWTTNFVEVQRAMASKAMNAAQRAPIIGSFPKMFIPFIIIMPGMIGRGPRHRAEGLQGRRDVGGGIDYNDALLLLMRDLLPNGMLGVAIAGLLAAFMAGMAANISAFNTVFSYDIWQDYVVKDKPDDYYTRVGRLMTVVATVIAIGTARVRVVVREHDGLPADVVRVLQRTALRDIHPRYVLETDDATAGWVGLVERHRGRRPRRHPQ